MSDFLGLGVLRLSAHAFLSFVWRGLGALAQFGFAIAVARLFGAEDFGLYSLSLSIVVTASTIGRWGVGQLAVRELSILASQEQWAGLKVYFTKVLLVVLALSILLSAFIWALIPWLSVNVFQKSAMLPFLGILVFFILPFSVLNVISEGFRSVGRIGLYAVTQAFLLPFISIVLLLCIYDGESAGVVSVESYTFASWVVCLFALWMWHRVIGFAAIDMSTLFGGLGKLLRTSSPFAWINIVTVAMSFMETLLLGYFRGSDEIALYSAALRLILIINFIIIAFNSVLGPRIAALYASQGASLELERFINRIILLMVAVSLPVLFVYLAFPKAVLGLFGAEFGRASTVLLILAVGQFVNILSGPVGVLLQMCGHERTFRRNVLMSALLGLAAGLVLVPSYGIFGAACSATTGMIVMNLLSLHSVRSGMGINLLMLSFLPRRRCPE